MLLIADIPIETNSEINYDPSSVFAEEVYVNSDAIPNKSARSGNYKFGIIECCIIAHEKLAT